MKKLPFIKENLGLMLILSVLIGVIVGVVDTIFGQILIYLTDLRSQHSLLLIPFLAPAGMLFTYYFLKYGKNSSKGMGLIFQAGHQEEDDIPKRLVPFVILGTWITHLFGGSAGREGVAIQVGASISLVAHSFMKRVDASQFIVIGMAAGFAGLFETPIAASFFALEVLTVGALRYDALLPTLFAAFSANITSKGLGLEKFSVAIKDSPSIDAGIFFKLVILGIIFGLCGGAFSTTLNKMKVLLVEKLPNPVRRVGIMGILLSVLLLLLFVGRYAGLGTNLINASFSAATIKPYDWLFKAILTILTVAAGFQGGEVTPLFAIGSTLGVVLSSIFALPATLVAALGYASVFGSATNTFLAPIMIGAEVFGFENLPYFFIVSSVAFVFNGNKSIYGNQKVTNMLK